MRATLNENNLAMLWSRTHQDKKCLPFFKTALKSKTNFGLCGIECFIFSQIKCFGYRALYNTPQAANVQRQFPFGKK